MGKTQGASAALLLLALLGFGFGGTAQAATQTPLHSANIMVVDLQTLLKKSKAAQMVSRQIREKRAEYNHEISEAEQKLKKEKDALEREQTTLSPKSLNEKERSFQKKLNAFKEKYRGEFEQMQAASNEALSTIQKTILKIVNKFAKERKADIVLPRAELLFWNKSFDVTDDVLAELDKDLPTVTVSFNKPLHPSAPAPAAPAPAARKRR